MEGIFVDHYGRKIREGIKKGNKNGTDCRCDTNSSK
jgi:hypothetical protein